MKPDADRIDPLDESLLSHRYVNSGGVRLHFVEAGSGPLVVLLHGFPEFWYGWRKQIAPLVSAGFRIAALDMRGYNLSDKPRGVRAYAVKTLADDVANVIDACGTDKAHVVGHDWGSGAAWTFAMAHREKLDRLALLNGPHPERLIRALRSSTQLAKSWYIFFFQLPWLPEALLRRGGFKALLAALRDNVADGAFTNEDLARYAEAYARPGALTAMVNYYRAAMRPGTAPPVTRIDAPVLSIWGEQDPYLLRELASPSPLLVPNARTEYIPDAGHFVQHERASRVNKILVEFLQDAR